MEHAWERREKHETSPENPKGRGHFGVRGVDARIILEWITEK
jgi:hypothetical protein